MFNEIRDHFDALVYEQAFDDPAAPMWLRRWRAATEVVRVRVLDMICRVRGHRYEPDGADYLESGGEGFSCARCGHSFTAWH